MSNVRSTLHALLSTIPWIVITAISLFAIVRVTDDYVTSVASLQNFRWRVAKFETPANDSTQINLTLEVQNRSSIALSMKELEIYLWANDVTVGKTYGRFEAHTIQAGNFVRVPLVIEVSPTALRDAKTKAKGYDFWRISGSYKVSTPLSDNDFLYRLNLDIAQ